MDRKWLFVCAAVATWLSVGRIQGGDATPLHIADSMAEEGKTVEARSTPTQFGPVAFKIVSHVKDGYIEASVKSPLRNPPKHMVLRLRHPEGKPMKAVTVNGKPHVDYSAALETVQLEPAEQPVCVRVDY